MPFPPVRSHGEKIEKSLSRSSHRGVITTGCDDWEINMKKGQIIEGVVERFDFPNKGIVFCEEGVCTVKNALPGKRCGQP